MALQELTPDLALSCFIRWRERKNLERRDMDYGLGGFDIVPMALGGQADFRVYAERCLAPVLVQVLSIAGTQPGAREAAITSFMLTVLQQGMEMGLMANAEGGVQ